jgi:hypothetical protein
MDPKLHAWWSHRQGLDGTLAGRTAAEVLEQTGWARSVGGASPYLALFARAGIRREEADAAVSSAAIHELPAARGCTYVVPAADYALALAAGHPFADDELKVARRLNVTDDEIANLRTAVLKALASAPLDIEALRTKVGDAARNLGPEGAKKGLTTTLPVAVGLLQSSGEIRRIPVNGRLDQQRYRYATWNPNPLAKWNTTTEQTFTDLARKFFTWTGPTTVAAFQEFAGLGVKAAKAAAEPLKLVTAAEDLLILPEDEEAFRKFKAPAKPQYTLTGSIDNIMHHHSSALDKQTHPILDRGEIVGKWAFDPETGTIAWTSSEPKSRALEEAVAKTEAYIREDLGDVRSFSLDSPKSRIPCIEALRRGAA